MESFNLSTVEYLQNQILPETIYHNLQPVNTNSAYNNNSSKKYLNCPEMNEESARNLLQLLEDWGFSYLYELFLDERMDVETLKTLNTTHLLNLCSSGKMQLGVAIKFETCLKKWQLMECTTESTESLMINEKMSKNNVYVKKILNDSPKGRLIINHFNKNNVLNDGCRAEILEIINNFLIQEEIKISSDLAKNISEQIVEEFPSEDLSMYYIKQPGKPAISKVSAKYYNAQRSLKCCGILGKRVYESRFSKSIKIWNEQCLHLEPEANHQDSLVEIANDNCSFAELEYHWNATKNYRAKDVAVIELNCSEIINKWPHYKKPLGYKLVDIDFSNIYPNAGNILDKFGEFSAKILPVLNSKVKDCHNKKILEHIHNSSKSENAKHTGILYLLHNLIPPVTKEVCTSSSSKQFTKFSVKDSQNSVFMFGETTNEIESRINKKIQQNLPVQPFIIVIGSVEEPKEFIVYFDGIRYMFPTVLTSIDCCFKIYNFFNLQYPNQSILFWNFLQQYVYNIKTTFDKHHPSISALIKKMNE